MSLETIRASKQGRDQLVGLKRWTGIANWNVLCRWAFCVSLTEPTPPRRERIPADSSLEMTWDTFGGENEEIYLGLLKERCRRDGLELTPETFSEQFRLHLHRGIRYLAGDPKVRGIAGLIRKALASGEPADAEQLTH